MICMLQLGRIKAMGGKRGAPGSEAGHACQVIVDRQQQKGPKYRSPHIWAYSPVLPMMHRVMSVPGVTHNAGRTVLMADTRILTESFEVNLSCFRVFSVYNPTFPPNQQNLF